MQSDSDRRLVQEHLGVDLAPADYSQKPWSQEAGPTVFAPFPQDSEHLGDAAKHWMINFRVGDLDAMVEQLRAAKIDVVCGFGEVSERTICSPE